ncbi:MAG: apolipoprotein N-acyltransferase [Zavarzinella sp.]|nr:apolipoprotein N-acyltransferase [Zavarzinella sp.]
MYDPSQPRSRVFLPAILSGLLQYAAYFPIDAGLLAWFALVPLLSLVHANARPRRIYFAAFVGGLFCYIPAIQWMRVAHPAMYAAWIFLAIYCSLCQTVAIWFVRRLDRVGVPLWLAVPVAWVSVDYFRAHAPTGFTWLEWFGARHPIGFGWYMLGHTQHDWCSLIQVADLGGVYAVTFLIALVNAVIWQTVQSVPSVRAWLRSPNPPEPRSVRPNLVAAGLLVAAVAYGVIRLNHEPFAEGPQVALVQGNLPQDVKNMHGDVMKKHFYSLADRAAEMKPDLVVWAETSYLAPWVDVAPTAGGSELPPNVERAVNFARMEIEADMVQGWDLGRPGWRTPSLFGLSLLEWESEHKLWRYNSALLVDANGQAVDRYDKIHLVPWGEYVPMKETFPFLKMFTPYEGDYDCKPGERWTRFPFTVGDRNYHFACLICYEDTDATLARTYVRPGAEGVDFFVNISNDGWFKGTAEHEQHLAICRFRAIETRRSIARAVNMGISAIINPDGRVVALPGETWGKSKKVEAVVRGPVPIDTRTTLYARFGDWLPLAGWAVILGGIVRGSFRRRPAA